MLEFGNEVQLKDTSTIEDDIAFLQGIKNLEDKLSNLSVTKSKLNFGASTEAFTSISEEAFSGVKEAIAKEAKSICDKSIELESFFNKKSSKIQTIELPDKLFKKLKYVAPELKLKTNKVGLYDLRQTAKEKRSWFWRFCASKNILDLLHVDRNYGKYDDPKFVGNDFNKVRDELKKARNFIAVLMMIRRLVEQEEKSENQKIVPPKKNTGKFKPAERREREPIKPAYQNGMY